MCQFTSLLTEHFDSTWDSIMAGKGFTIKDILPLGISLDIPPFLGMSDQMSPEDVIKTQHTASLRIQVERAIKKVKNFLIFEGVIPSSSVRITTLSDELAEDDATVN